MLEGIGDRRFGISDDEGFSFVGESHDAGVKGEVAEVEEAEVLSGLFAAAFAEKVGDFAAVGAVEARHIFDKTEDWHVHGAGHGGGFAGVEKGDFLGGGDDDDTVEVGEELHDAEGFITGARW